MDSLIGANVRKSACLSSLHVLTHLGMSVDAVVTNLKAMAQMISSLEEIA
jgi:hypothetical protein